MKFTLVVALAALAGTSLALPSEPVAGGECTGTITKTAEGYEFCGAAAGSVDITGFKPGKANGCLILPFTK